MEQAISPRHHADQLPLKPISRSTSPSCHTSTSGSTHQNIIQDILACVSNSNDDDEQIRSNNRASPDTSSSEDDNDKYLSLSVKSTQEQEAEEWLTRRKELLVSLNWDEFGVPHETQSTMSSPGRSSLNERLRHSLFKQNSHSFHQLSIEEACEEVDDDLVVGNLTNFCVDDADDYGVDNDNKDRNDDDDRYSSVSTEQYPPPTARSASPSASASILGNKNSAEGGSIASYAFTPRPLKRHAPIPLIRPNTFAPPQLNDSFLRLSRTVRYGRRGEVPVTRKVNQIRLHIYDLIHTDTIMRMPWGCDFPIGKCFQVMNNGLRALGTGAYHCGIEINGIEYAYGANELEGSTGVFTCIPKHSPGYAYRSTIDFGDRQVITTKWALQGSENADHRPDVNYREISSYLDGRDVMTEMATEYQGIQYDLLRKNCCTFAKDASLRLGVRESEIPHWFMNLAVAGKRTRDFSEKAWEPISYFIPRGTTDAKPRSRKEKQDTGEGFEVIAQDRTGAFKVVEAVERDEKVDRDVGVRRTLSWTY